MRQTFLQRLTAVILIAVINTFGPPSIRVEASDTGATATRNGCANQWMFNGVWRVRLTGFAPHVDSITNKQTGWDATEQWRNGTDRTLSPISDSFTLSQQMVLQNGDKIATVDSTTATLSQQQIDYHQFPPSAQFTHVQTFIGSTVDPNNKPVAVIIPFDASKLKTYPGHPAFSVSPPNYRIKFDCSPTELAAAAAQGGSHEVAAHEGCVNQWLSNGVWRMRLKKLGPAIDPTTNKQTGWIATEDWKNLTGKTITPVITAVQDQQIVLQNGDTVSSGNATTTTLNFQQLVYHSFAAGASFTHAQRFWPGTFDAANKPVKLLVMFDAKTQAKYTNLPQFTSGPPNMRIKLDCTN
jgi:hypothetical protein